MHNCGAFNTLGLVVPYNSLTHLVGMYDVPVVDVELSAVITNTGVTAPYRGAGRPEAVFAMERIVDRVARTLGNRSLRAARAQRDPARRRCRTRRG